MTDINQVKNAILRKSFSSFVQKCFYELNPSEAFIKRRVYRLIMRSNPKYDRGKKSEIDNQSSSKIFKIGYMFYSFARVYFGA